MTRITERHQHIYYWPFTHGTCMQMIPDFGMNIWSSKFALYTIKDEELKLNSKNTYHQQKSSFYRQLQECNLLYQL